MTDRDSGLGRPLSVVLGGVLVVAVLGMVVFVVAPVPATPADTEFYVLNESGVADYPETLAVQQSASVLVTVENHEHEQVSYELVVRHDGDRLDSATRTLSDGGEWNRTVDVSFEEAGDESVEFLLYRAGEAEPYRRLSLQITVVQEP